jgi:hypothetical protein
VCLCVCLCVCVCVCVCVQELFFPVVDCIEAKACAEGQAPPLPGAFAKEVCESE